jgi:hypothetical protein
MLNRLVLKFGIPSPGIVTAIDLKININYKYNSLVTGTSQHGMTSHPVGSNSDSE